MQLEEGNKEISKYWCIFDCAHSGGLGARSEYKNQDFTTLKLYHVSCQDQVLPAHAGQVF